ncbi:hypothetical protein AB0D99_30985 [Streptomyces sp. NPDC047971]|uniref:hypothetical protein n=1 Tax=Streptomyces sp. NPDC047971 TaxID=3154499 RepID=UPI0033CF3B86
MGRLQPLHLTHHGKLLPRQTRRDRVAPLRGRVRVYEHSFHRLLDGRRAPSLFLVWTPRLHDGAGVLVPCTAEACDRWVKAAVAYATAVDDASARLEAAYRRAVAVPGWKYLAVRRAVEAWEETRQRYEREMREAGEAYAPVGREIGQAIEAEKRKVVERAREAARREEEARRRRKRLAERPLWGWAVVTEEGWRAAYAFRHDVARDEAPLTTPLHASPRVDLAGLRQALMDLDLPTVVWDGAALAEAERELDGVGFGAWWRELFHENYRTITSPPSRPAPAPRGNPSGGSATGGSGGFGGGHSGGFGDGGHSGGGFSCAGGGY